MADLKSTTVRLPRETLSWAQDKCHEMREEMPGGFSQWLRELLAKFHAADKLPRVEPEFREGKNGD